MQKEIRHIILIGSGNIAWHFLNAFRNKDIRILQVLARNEFSARTLSDEFQVPYIRNVDKLDHTADLYILAVTDDQITPVAESLQLTDQLLVHTSGFSSMELLRGASTRTGVIWPLQTLTKNQPTDYRQVPVFIEANSPGDESQLMSFAGLISDHVMMASHRVRQRIHLAAVIASNLTNHLYAIAAAVMEKENIPFEWLDPLIRETAKKAAFQHPGRNQTGPAVRKDYQILEKHMDMLQDDPEFREIYRLISESIIHHHNSNR